MCGWQAAGIARRRAWGKRVERSGNEGQLYCSALCGGGAPGASIPQVAIPLRTPAPPAPRSRDNTEKLNAQLSAANR